ncbi:MAG TPA: hypothetical protein DCG19_14980 [Cryomorphaceae bacterium]|nr:hypothetical protein [Owenweeksia sp.]MBF99796.1 hypothetical protein [Owenweeksia sp.]HAD98714.1 hypothetical protein [Cryomorphaceae bacterium]HBF19135.1 hypothetical protein [Cryomorphaceae bacterium]HCQ16274.1 hypothetical protein [Cryomorphaceae bacterium]|tara:strand:- start:10 stop:585 length:576 start_codon:yes stop_codon:yes gene_type:complete
MRTKWITVILFVMVALVQLYIPASMIWAKNEVLESGTEYRFKTAPVDPEDPFRGKYITLNFDENTFDITDPDNWKIGETVYAFLSLDSLGFAVLDSVSKQVPDPGEDYIKTKIAATLISFDTSAQLRVDYPFNRFYMEESKAPKAEQAYLQAQRDSSQVTYALVSVKNGDAVLKDVVINGVSVREFDKADK